MGSQELFRQAFEVLFTEIRQEARLEILGQVDVALGPNGKATRRPSDAYLQALAELKGHKPTKATARPPARAVARPVMPAGKPGRGHGAKREAGEIENLIGSLRNFIAKNPNMRIEQISKEMRVPTKDLKLPMLKLKGDKVVTQTGTRRSATYKLSKA